MKFEPRTLQAQLHEALKQIDKHAFVTINEVEVDAGSDLSILSDELLVTDSTPVELTFSRSDPIDLTVADLIAFAAEVRHKATSFDGLVYHSPYRALFSVDVREPRTDDFLNKFAGKLDVVLNVSDVPVTVRVIRHGSAHFSFAIVANHYHYDKYYLPYHSNDIFVEITYPRPVEVDDCLNIIHAYLFELVSTFGVHLYASPRALDGIDYPDDDELEHLSEQPLRMRPLLVGPGLGPLLEEFHRANDSRNDADVALLGYVKCMEYVAATVVRSKQYEDVRRRLVTPEALNPTASYIDGLLALFEENRMYMKDHEALRLTVERCCDARLLAPHAPESLRALSGLKADAKLADRKAALNEFAACLSATRNEFAHAKANYETTGKECHREHLPELAECARVAAEQCIRWYADVNPSLRRI